LSGILVIGYTAKGYGHDAGGEGSHGENTSDIVHLTSAVHQRDSRAGVFIREYKQIDRGAGSANADINVEGPALVFWAIGETTPGNGSKNRSETPG